MQKPKKHSPYTQVMELESIIEQMAEAFRKADIEYMAAFDHPTISMELAWTRYIEYTRKYAKKNKNS